MSTIDDDIDLVTELNTGDYVRVRAHTSKLFKGLSYPAFAGILLEDAGVSEGWDVVDVSRKLDDGTTDTVSIYCFSLIRD